MFKVQDPMLTAQLFHCYVADKIKEFCTWRIQWGSEKKLYFHIGNLYFFWLQLICGATNFLPLETRLSHWTWQGCRFNFSRFVF